jgi:hypothetical protein
MNVVSVSPLRVASLAWQTSRGVPVLTVIAKATYQLLPTACTLAEEQEDPNDYESHWNYDTARSLHSPSDLVPYKPRPEVTLVGQAFAPRGEPATRLVARLIVGNVDKSIVVHGERSFSQDGTLRSGTRFSRMPLRYERAAGGPETSNPVGVQARPDALGAVTLPNLEPPALNVTRPDELIEPIGFGPIAADWPTRRTRLGTQAGSWSLRTLSDGPLPASLDPLYFLSAPPDQYLDELRANERIVLENLHADHPRLATSLPGYEPRAFVERSRGAVSDLPMVCDTLWIDTDRSMCTATWRGQLTLSDVSEQGRVVIGMEMIGRPLAWSSLEELAGPPSRPTIDIERTQPRQPPGATNPAWKRQTATHDVRSGGAPNWPGWLASGDGDAPPRTGDILRDGAVPGALRPSGSPEGIEGAITAAAATLTRPGLPHPPPVAPPMAPMMALGNTTPRAPDASAPSWLRAPPPQRAPTQPRPSPSWAPPPGPTRAPMTPPPMAPSAPSASPPAAPLPAQRPSYAELPSGLRPAEPPPPVALRSSYSDAPSALRQADPPPPARIPAAADLRQATERGAAAASNAAAAAAKVAGAPAARPGGAEAAGAQAAREPPRDHVDLLWFDAAALPRIRADKVLGEARPPKPPPTWLKEQPGQREPQEAKDRREVLAFLSRGRALEELAAIGQAASAAYQADGTYVAPLALVAGELAFDFDEVETLRAILTVTGPFLGGDKKLREVTGGAVEALKIEGRLPSDIAEGFSRRIEEAFAQGQRSVAPGYLDTRVERILLEGRRYQKKTLFGEPRLRALLTFPGGAAGSGPTASGPVPTYLPEALSKHLPLYRRFKARAIVELRPQEDQYETHADALLVLVLGRLLRRAS